MSNHFKGAVKRYLSEVIVIFLGISISFWFDEWRNHRRERELEYKMLQNLKENLVQDTLLISLTAGGGELMAKGVEKLVQFKQDAEIIDSVSFYIDMAASYTGILANQTAYEEMKQTGNTRLIQNDSLKKSILGHYTSLIPYVKEWCDVDKTHTMTQLIPEMSLYFPVVIDTLNWVSPAQKVAFLKTPKLRYMLVANLAYKREAVKALRVAHANSKRLIGKIDEVLQR